MSVEMFYTTLPRDIERERTPGNLVFKPKLSTSHFISFVYKHNELKTIQKISLCAEHVHLLLFHHCSPNRSTWQLTTCHLHAKYCRSFNSCTSVIHKYYSILYETPALRLLLLLFCLVGLSFLSVFYQQRTLVTIFHVAGVRALSNVTDLGAVQVFSYCPYLENFVIVLWYRISVVSLWEY